MKLKINKACDLSSISVLPPQARRPNAISNGTQLSQHRSQPSQQSFSQSMFSQLSQNSVDENLTNEQRFCSQERENSMKRLCFPPNNHSREERQMLMSRSSTNLTRKWNSASLPDHRCQISEELDRRIGTMETSLNKFGMFMDSIQSDIMQVNRATKEVSLETEGIRQKLLVQDDMLQLMNKEQDGIKASLDGGFRSIAEQVNQDIHQHKLKEIFLVLSTLPEKIEASILKSQSELYNSSMKKMQTMAHPVINSPKDQPSILSPKDTSCGVFQRGKPHPNQNSSALPKVCAQATIAPKIETGGWKAVKKEKATFTKTVSDKVHKQIRVSSTKQERECRIIIESDEDSDGGFSCLLEETAGEVPRNYFSEDVKEETDRILKKARKRKRKCRKAIKPIIIS